MISERLLFNESSPADCSAVSIPHPNSIAVRTCSSKERRSRPSDLNFERDGAQLVSDISLVYWIVIRIGSGLVISLAPSETSQNGCFDQ